MKEIVSRLTENRQIQLSKEILESSGYEVSKKLDESALDKFWDLYDSDNAVADALEEIAGELGISDEAEISERDAQRILDVYSGDHSLEVINSDKLISEIMYAIEDLPIIKNVKTFEDAEVLTRNKGFVVTDRNGNEYQFSLLGSF